MRLTTLIILLFSLGSFSQNYVSSLATGSGDGTQANPWTLAQGFTNTTCGETTYIRAGNYGSSQFTVNKSCSPGNEARFVATNSSWQPLTLPTIASRYDGSTVTRATFTGDDDITSGVLPYLDQGTTIGTQGTGTGLSVSGSGVWLDGFAVKGYATGIRFTGTAHIGFNLAADLQGDHRGVNCCSGVNIDVSCTDGLFANLFARDGAHIGISNAATGNFFQHVEIQTRSINLQGGNTTDYQFLANAQGTYFDINIIRANGTDHLSHGFVVKPQTGTASGNMLDRFYLENCKLEVQGGGAENGTFRNGLIKGTGSPYADYYATSINIINGARNNRFENITVWRGTWTIHYENWDEGYANDLNISGSGNTFVNIVGIDPQSAQFGFWERNGNSNTAPTNENYYHCTFIGGTFAYNNANAMNGGATGGIYNSIITSTNIGDAATMFSPSFIFNRINTPLNLTPYNESNITNVAFSFTDAMVQSDVFGNFDYTPTTNVLDIGEDRTSIAPFDILGRTRGVTLGAFQFGATTPPPTTPLQNSVVKQKIMRQFFNW